MVPDLTFTFGGLVIAVGVAWKLSRDMTTLQVTVSYLTQRIVSLETAVTGFLTKAPGRCDGDGKE